MTVLSSLKKAKEEGKISEKIYRIFLHFYQDYKEVLERENISFAQHEKFFVFLLEEVKQEIAEPSSFPPYHERIRTPFDYYQFGIEFIEVLVNKEKSTLLHVENVEKMIRQLVAKENVVLFANHQTEVDPQLISIALDNYPAFAEEMIFVAGDRVLTDPMAVPFSKGRNLLCIYSKRHIANPPEKRLEKQQHNRKTMQRFKEILSLGGKAIYVAPSGGRDRPNAQGKVEVAPFDPDSIEMFRLMAKEAKRPTHFYPLSLSTFSILPPPPSIESEVGEMRKARRDGIHFAFGDELDMQHFPGSDLEDRHERRKACATYIWNIVKKNYDLLNPNG